MKILDSIPFKVALVAASITTIGIVAFALDAPGNNSSASQSHVGIQNVGIEQPEPPVAPSVPAVVQPSAAPDY